MHETIDKYLLGFANGGLKEHLLNEKGFSQELCLKSGVLKKINNVVADFFSGGGTTAAVAQRRKRKWIACDQSRVAVAITADRISQLVQREVGSLFQVPDFTVEHWGIYEVERLSKMPADQFRAFVVRAFGAVPDGTSPHIHGYKGAIPVWVGRGSLAGGVFCRTREECAWSDSRFVYPPLSIHVEAGPPIPPTSDQETAPEALRS